MSIKLKWRSLFHRVGEWHDDPWRYETMRRLLPDGEWQYRKMTEAESEGDLSARAW